MERAWWSVSGSDVKVLVVVDFVGLVRWDVW